MAASFDYTVIRVVPRVERQEFINAGVVVYCPEKRYLGARIHLDEARLKALWPDVDVETVGAHLRGIELICAGDAAGGAIAQMPLRERFHWLSAPRSTMIQPSPVHTGVCAEAGDLLERLVAQYLTV